LGRGRSGRRHARGGPGRGAGARARRVRGARHRTRRDAGGARVPRILPAAGGLHRGRVVNMAGIGEGKPDLSAGESVIVRWSLDELPAVLAELGLERPFLVASARWSLHVPVVGRWSEIPSHRVEAAPGADSLLAVGGGSAIDTAKNASA